LRIGRIAHTVILTRVRIFIEVRGNAALATVFDVLRALQGKLYYELRVRHGSDNGHGQRRSPND
jgi:hypothetical protein